MSSIPPSGHQKIGFRPVIRRNSTVKRPLPVPPPVPPILPSYNTRPLSHPDINGISSFNRNSSQSTSPCAKIYTGGNNKQKPILPTTSIYDKSKSQNNLLATKSRDNGNKNNQCLETKPSKYSKEKSVPGVNVTNTSVVIINESKVDTKPLLVQNKSDISVKRKNKLSETKKLQVLTKYEEESPKLSAASFIFRSLKTSQRSKPLRFCDFQQVYDTLDCDKSNDQDLTKLPPLIYETQEICLWLSDDGDYATEDVFSSSLGRNLEIIKNILFFNFIAYIYQNQLN